MRLPLPDGSRAPPPERGARPEYGAETHHLLHTVRCPRDGTRLDPRTWSSFLDTADCQGRAATHAVSLKSWRHPANRAGPPAPPEDKVAKAGEYGSYLGVVRASKERS